MYKEEKIMNVNFNMKRCWRHDQLNKLLSKHILVTNGELYKCLSANNDVFIIELTFYIPRA